MKRKATSEIDDLCSAVKKMKLEKCRYHLNLHKMYSSPESERMFEAWF